MGPLVARDGLRPTQNQSNHLQDLKNMSFGFGVGDFIAVGKICWNIYTKCKDSPGNYKQLSGEVSSLYAVIRETELLLSKQSLSPAQQARLTTCRQGCESVLKDLDGFLVKYESLGTKSQRTFDRMAFGSHDMNEIRLRLTSNVTMLDAFNNASSHEKLEKKLDMLISEVRAGKREGSIVSTRSFGTAAENNKEIWEALRRELEDVGISPELITEKRHFIVAWFQEAVAAGRLEEEAPSEEDDDSIAHGGSWSSAGNSDSISVINQERPSHPFRREMSKRSSRDVNNLDLPSLTSSSRSVAQIPREAITEAGTVAGNSVKPNNAQKLPKVEKKSRLSVSYLLAKLLSKDEQLFRAASGGWNDRVRALLDGGVDIEARVKEGAIMREGATALILAAEHGHSQIIQLLLDKGANVNAESARGTTALYVAAEHGHGQIIQFLLDKGANVNAKSMSGLTALCAAAEHGHSQVIQLLFDNGVDVNEKSRSGWTALYVAARRDETVGIVQMLLDKNADINSTGTKYHPIVIAAESGSVAVLQLLIDRGAYTEVTDINYRTALQEAAYCGRERSVKLLIEHGAAMEATNLIGYTALNFAVRRGHGKVVKLLLDKGANIEAIDSSGFRPLHSAVSFDEAEMARLLLEYGAKTDVRDNDGRTPLQLAEEEERLAVAKILRAAEKYRSGSA